MDRKIDGLPWRLQSQPVLAGVPNELRVNLVDSHPHDLILGGGLESQLPHLANVIGRDLVDAELHELVDAHAAESE